MQPARIARSNVGSDDRRDAEEIPLRFLIVDDNEGFLQAARTHLERQGIQVVGTARTAAEGLLRHRELRPDVILIDIGLGNDNGFDLAREVVAADESRPQVVLISSRAEEEYAGLIEESPAVGFLSKARLSADAIFELLGTDPS